MSVSWQSPRTRGVGSRDIHELTGIGAGVGFFDLLFAFLIDLVVYPFSAWILRSLTGQSLGDRVCNLVYSRPDGSRAGIWRYIVLDAARFMRLPLSYIPVEFVAAFFAYRIAGLTVDKTF